MGEDAGVSTCAAMTGGATGAAAAGGAAAGSAVGAVVIGTAAGDAAPSPSLSALDAAAEGCDVVKSTVTLRVDAGAINRRFAGAAGGLGPDSNSGTTSTMRATKIDAPIKRSLRRRSIAI
jgi:hypothetical protein